MIHVIKRKDVIGEFDDEKLVIRVCNRWSGDVASDGIGVAGTGSEPEDQANVTIYSDSMALLENMLDGLEDDNYSLQQEWNAREADYC